ncbi:MAG: 4Fe-4S cluster-binding domain-containing protein [Synergistaceae bacterium]|nr:4Fe-4S cluster-binding domain-containing protein [Synergistaceae bacterium]
MPKHLSSMLKNVERVTHIHGLHDSARKIYRCVRWSKAARSLKYLLTVSRVIPFRISNLVISTGQACSYKCRDCGNFAPYSPSKFMRYSFEELSGWMTMLAESVDSIRIVQIQGGEPFLYSELGKLIQFLRELRMGGGVLLLI